MTRTVPFILPAISLISLISCNNASETRQPPNTEKTSVIKNDSVSVVKPGNLLLLLNKLRN